MPRVRPLTLVLVVSCAIALLAAASSQGAPTRAPTRLYYNITVQYLGTEGYTTSRIARDETGAVVDQRTMVSHFGSLRWTAKTNESVLLRRLPDGRVTFISSGAATVRFEFDEYGMIGQQQFVPGFVSTPPCEQEYKGGVHILTTGELSLSGGGTFQPALVANVNAPPSELTTKLVSCVYQRYPEEQPVAWQIQGEEFKRQQRAHLSGFPDLGWSATVAFGNNLRLNFGRSAIAVRHTHSIDLDGVHERDVTGQPVSIVKGSASATTIVVFTRCPHPRPCR
jgi:hypothetical protein